MAGEVVKVINKQPELVTWQYNSTPYPLRPGIPAIVPVEAMWLWMGHPDAVDIDERRRPRTEEYRRLQIKYGAYADRQWEDVKPRIEVYDLDDNRIYTVVDDPDGERLTPETRTIHENQLLMERMEQQERELKQLRQILDVQQRAAEAEKAATHVTEDGSDKPYDQDKNPYGTTNIPEPIKPAKPDLPSQVTEDIPHTVKA